jgi:hypothetical protein
VESKIVTVLIKDDEKRFSAHQIKNFMRDEAQISFSYQLNEMLSPFKTIPSRSSESTSYLTEMIKPGDPRVRLFADAKRKEIKGLIERGTFQVVEKSSSVPSRVNVLGGLFALALKDEGTPRNVLKARFVVQGYRNQLETSLVHDTTTSKQHSSRLLVGLAAIFGFRLFSTDVIQAYL